VETAGAICVAVVVVKAVVPDVLCHW